MKTRIFPVIVAAITFTVAGVLPAQNQPPAVAPAPAAVSASHHVNAAIIPVPRVGEMTNRQSLVLQRARENSGACDVVFIGDSITHAWEFAGSNVWRKFYGHRKCLNFGVAGDRTEHVLWRFENGQLDGIRPKAVVLLIGTNNTGRDPEADILEGVQAVVKQLRARLVETKIILLATFPRGQTFSLQRGRILQVNQALAKLDDGKSVFYIDFGSQLIEADGSISLTIMRDYLHLTEHGYEIWAQAIEPKLKEILGK